MMDPEKQSPPGIIGMGLMGSAMMKATGAERGWDLDPARCVNAVSMAEVFDFCDRVILCLPDSRIVAEVLRDAPLRPGQIVIDTGTGDPEEIETIGREMAERGVSYLDATVSGSSAQVVNRDVLVTVGGDAAVFERCRELLLSFAREVVHVGPCGSGARMKLVGNLVLGLNRAALAEGLVFAERLRLDPARTLDILRRGLAYSRIMDTKGEKMIARDFEPQAKLSQHLKDVRLIEAASGLPLPLTKTHRQLLERAESLGYGDADNSAVIEAIREL